MSLFLTPGLKALPGGFPVWDAGLGALPEGFLFTRASVGQRLWGTTYANAVHETVASGVPRFERLPFNDIIGLKIDHAQTNASLYGDPDPTIRFGGPQAENTVENITWGGVWTKAVRSPVTVTSGSFAYASVAPAASVPVSCSFLARRMDGLPIVVGGTNSTTDATIDFAVNCSGSGGSTIVGNLPLGNGVHLITAYKVDSGVSPTNYGPVKGPANRAGQVEWTALTTSGISGRQLGSPVLTNGVALTRAFEVCQKAVLPADFNEFTVYLDFYDPTPPLAAAPPQVFWCARSQDAITKILIYMQGPAYYIYHVSAVETGFSVSLKSSKPGATRLRAAVRRKADGSISSCCDGGPISIMSGGSFRTVNTLANEYLGSESSGQHGCGHIIGYGRVAYAMTDTQMQDLTKWKPEDFSIQWDAASLVPPTAANFSRASVAQRWWD